MQKTACDTSVYKKQCGAMDAESPVDIGECGKYQARSFFEDCSTCPSGCVDAPTSGDSGSGSGSNDGGSGDSGTVKEMKCKMEAGISDTVADLAAGK